MHPSINQFFSVNRFLYDSFQTFQIRTMKDLAVRLNLSLPFLRKKFMESRFPTTVASLQQKCQQVTFLEDPPIIKNVYKFVSLFHNDDLDSRFLELMYPEKPYHFDYFGVLKSKYSFFRNLINIEKIVENIKFDRFEPFLFELPDFDLESKSFKKKMEDNFNNLPNLLKNLSGDERYHINSHISIAFLYGNVCIPEGGIASPHLTGTFSLNARKAGTGYLNLDSLLNGAQDIVTNKIQSVLNWLKAHNQLYNCMHVLDVDFFRSRIDPLLSAPNDIPSVALIEPEYTSNIQENLQNIGKIPLTLLDSNGQKCVEYLDLEAVLPLCFPLLFPFGPLPKIPGNTIRNKARNLLSSHPFYRCGRLQCSLILYLYHQMTIQKAIFCKTKCLFKEFIYQQELQEMYQIK